MTLTLNECKLCQVRAGCDVHARSALPCECIHMRYAIHTRGHHCHHHESLEQRVSAAAGAAIAIISPWYALVISPASPLNWAGLAWLPAAVPLVSGGVSHRQRRGASCHGCPASGPETEQRPGMPAPYAVPFLGRALLFTETDAGCSKAWGASRSVDCSVSVSGSAPTRGVACQRKPPSQTPARQRMRTALFEAHRGHAYALHPQLRCRYPYLNGASPLRPCCSCLELCLPCRTCRV